ncbi:MAG: glycosyltransferase family 39 protein [Ktedonobacterales bacterium]|nr:glycosyltransferase family 39 protein [Ktedonobacterales bacterium]
MDSGTTLPDVFGVAAGQRLSPVWCWVLAQRARLALVCITAAGLGLRLGGLADKSLWIDETFSVGMVTQSWGSFLHTVGTVQPNMELFYFLVKLLATLTPVAWQHGETFWRLVPALAGTAIIPATYALTRRLFATPVALGAAALVAVNEFLVEYSQQARGYTLFVLLLTLSYLALARWLAGEQRALWWFAALAVLGFLTQAFEVVFLAAQLAFVAGVWLRRRVLPWRALLALLPLGVVVALRYPIYAAHPDQVSWIQRPTRSDLFHGVRQLVGGDGGVPNAIGNGIVLLVVVGILGLIGWSIRPFFIRERHSEPQQAAHDLPTLPRLRAVGGALPARAGLDRCEAVALVVLWFIIPVAGTWLGSQVKPVWVTRYLAPCAVPACIILAAAVQVGADQLARLSQRVARGGPRPGIYGVALVALVLAAALPWHDYATRSGWEDWRGAATTVAARFQPNDGIVCYDNQWGCDFGFSHYFVSLGGAAQFDPAAPGVFSWATYARPDREAIFAQAVAPASLADYLAHHPRLWVLLGHYSSGSGDWRAGLAWLADHAHLASKVVFAGDIEVYLYAR